MLRFFDMIEAEKHKLLEAYDLYADAIYRHCYFRVFRKELAEELMQDTFMRAWEYMGNGNKIDNVRAFLYKIANNLIIDYSRKKKEESLEGMLENSYMAEPAYAPAFSIESKLLLDEVKKYIHTLEDEYKEVLIMRYVDDLDPKDIAEVLGVSANVVSVRLNRAMKALKVNMGDKGVLA